MTLSDPSIREEYGEPSTGKACDEKGWVFVEAREALKDK